MEIKFETKQALSSPQQVMETIHKLWSEFPEYDKARENCFIMYLNTKNKLLCVELHAQGTIDQAIVYPREIIRKALFCNATGVIVIHNHPSDICNPSNEDKMLTTRIKEACNIMDIKLLDHIIIAGKEYFSFQEENLI